LSPRAACRLETLGFQEVYDYVPSKVDWLARGLPMEGEKAEKALVWDILRQDVVTASLHTRMADVRERVGSSPYGFALVVTEGRTLLGRLRKGGLQGGPDARAEDVMEPGPSTLRPDMTLDDVIERLRKRDLKTALVTDPEGRLLGLVRRVDME
jgi:CBS domain-containing protein